MQSFKKDHEIMAQSVRQQLLISGVGGQGVLLVTRLLAEAAIRRDIAVLTSETHGMAQRGGTVLSHLKVGDFYSPLIRSGQADGLIVLKSENLIPHAVFLKSGGWAIVNAAPGEKFDLPGTVFDIDADAIAQRTGSVKSANLIALGYALAVAEKIGKEPGRLFCRRADLERVIESTYGHKKNQAADFLRAIQAGYNAL
jgi:indolepyruvate ferredoxin oxidoreductase, beta subunit